MNKFWNKNRNYVVTRERGDIPGITPAKDIFVSIPLEEMQAATALRAQRYCTLIDDVICGAIKYQSFRAHPFHSTDVSLSPIVNPSKPYKKDW